MVGAQSAATATWLGQGTGRSVVIDSTGQIHELPEARRWPALLPGSTYVSSTRNGTVLVVGGRRSVNVVPSASGRTVGIWGGSERVECHAAQICECGRHVAMGIIEEHRVPRSTSLSALVDLVSNQRWNLKVGTTFLADFPSAIAFARDCSLAAFSSGKSVYVVDMESKAAIRRFEAQRRWASGVAFDGSSTLLARSTKEGWIEVWEVASGRQLYQEKWHVDVWGVDVDAARGLVAFAAEDGAHIISLRTKAIRRVVELIRCCSIALRDDGLLTVIGSRNVDAAPSMKRIKTWDLPGTAVIGPVIVATAAVGD